MTKETEATPPVLLERPAEGVALLRLNRPKALNSLNSALMSLLVEQLRAMDEDPQTRCVVVAGGAKAFAAGADIEEMKAAGTVEMYLRDHLSLFDAVRQIKTPLVAAVSGWCLGGGLELALSCDVIIASEGARFGQPEINLGIIPGAGATQRLPRVLGKSVAMDLILTGRNLEAAEAERLGLVSRVVPDEELEGAALELAGTIAAKPPLAVRAAKEAVLKSFDLPIESGLAYERNLFFLLFSSEDQKEGMDAFLGKRAPVWKGR